MSKSRLYILDFFLSRARRAQKVHYPPFSQYVICQQTIKDDFCLRMEHITNLNFFTHFAKAVFAGCELNCV